MKITIESTTTTVTIDGIPARLWEGKTDSGIPVHCFITRIGVPNGCDHEQFERELQECHAPTVAYGTNTPLTLFGGN